MISLRTTYAITCISTNITKFPPTLEPVIKPTTFYNKLHTYIHTYIWYCTYNVLYNIYTWLIKFHNRQSANSSPRTRSSNFTRKILPGFPSTGRVFPTTGSCARKIYWKRRTLVYTRLHTDPKRSLITNAAIYINFWLTFALAVIPDPLYNLRPGKIDPHRTGWPTRHFQLRNAPDVCNATDKSGNAHFYRKNLWDNSQFACIWSSALIALVRTHTHSKASLAACSGTIIKRVYWDLYVCAYLYVIFVHILCMGLWVTQSCRTRKQCLLCVSINTVLYRLLRAK